ncbi:MAG: ABC transporter ATP-binding protein [Bdellovibrionales bacterium]|nr:ABC transporter ATP-binding protein [Bdellovibrionales bacterium]
MSEAVLKLSGIQHSFPGGAGQVLSPLDLDIPTGQFLTFLGPSGSGKSTILRIVAGLLKATSGQVQEKGNLCKKAFVFQDAELLPWRNVLDNAALPLEIQGVDLDDRRKAAQTVLQDLGLGDSLSLYPSQLSGGMKMRVSLARALVTQPDLLLMDEPFAALDEVIRFRLAEHLREIWLKCNRSGKPLTVLFVTHSMTEAVFLSQRILVLSSKPARVLLDHTVGISESRDQATRADPAFAREVHQIYSVFQKAGEA